MLKSVTSDTAMVKSLDQEPSSIEIGLVQSLSLAAATFNGKGQLIALNHAFRDLLPEPEAELSLRQLFADLTFSIGRETHAHTADAEFDPWLVSYPAIAHSRTTDRSYTLNSARYTNNGERRLLLIVEDSTAQFTAQRKRQAIHEQLLQTARALSVGEMATVLAHELNQPLGAIHNYLATASRLAGKQDTSPQICDAINFADQQALQASDVINRIREFVHAREPKFTECTARSLLERPLSLLQLELNSQHISIEMTFSEALPKVTVDTVMVEQVFANLIRNAIEAMEKTPVVRRKITLTAKSIEEKRIEFRVTDQGAGIAEEHQHKVFNPFFTTKDNGMGAGLAICRSIIELHGGRLYYDSSTAGRSVGSTFVCTLPAVD